MEDSSSGEVDEAAHPVDHRRLPRTVRSNQTQDLRRAEVQVDPIHGANAFEMDLDAARDEL
jgi:hypothetical protein